MAKWDSIVIHCSASRFGSAAEIRQWHLKKGWDDIGYHFVVPNGMIKADFYLPMMDGSVEIGRRIDGDEVMTDAEQGAHVYGFNKGSIAICMVGNKIFTPRQIATTQSLCIALMTRFDISKHNIKGHYELDNAKTCPNIDMHVFRTSIDPSNILIAQ